MDKHLKEVLQWRQLEEQSRAEKEQAAKIFSEAIVDNAEVFSVLDADLQEEMEKIIVSIKWFLENLENVSQFIKNNHPTPSGRAFVVSVLTLSARLIEFVAEVNNYTRTIDHKNRTMISWVLSTYSTMLVRYAIKFAKP